MIYLISIQTHREIWRSARALGEFKPSPPHPDHFRIASRIAMQSEGCSERRATVGDSAVSRATIGRRVGHSAAAQ